MNTINNIKKMFCNKNIFAYMIACITPILYFPIYNRYDSYTVKFIFMGILSMLFIIFNNDFFSKLNLKSYKIKSLCLYLFFVIISIPFSTNIMIAVFGSPNRLSGFITLLFYVCIYFMGRYARKLDDTFFICISISSTLVCIFSICQYYNFTPYTSIVYKHIRLLAPTGTMGNTNFLGTYLSITLPISIYLLSIRKKYYILPFLLLQVYCTIISGARSSWLSLVIVILIYFILSYKYKYISKLHFKCLSVIFALSMIFLACIHMILHPKITSKFLTIFNDFHTFTVKGFSASSAGSHRVFVWEKSIAILKKHPIFGVGIENLQFAMKKYFYTDVINEMGRYVNYDKAHNEFLDIAVSTGIASMISYILFLYYNIKGSFYKIKKSPEFLIIFICILSYLIQSLFNISVPNVAYMFWLFLGVFSNKKSF